MEKRIYKYPILHEKTQVVKLPKGAEILTVQSQFNDPVMWVLIDPFEQDTEERDIEIYGTGHPIHYGMGVDRRYISTYQTDNNYVFHIFERVS